MKSFRFYFALILFPVFLFGCGPGVLPEMQECMDAHGSLDKYREVIKKYASPELLQDITVCCTLKNSRIINSEKAGDIIYYWEEGTLLETSYEMPSDVIQIIKVGWKNKKIVFLEFLGPMKFQEKKYTKSKENRAREKKILP